MVTRPSKGIVDIFNAIASSDLAGWVVTTGSMPNKPDKCITVYDSGGRDPEARLSINYPSIQVVVRASEKEYAAAWDQCDKLKGWIHGINEVNAAAYPDLRSCLMTGEITDLGRDENNRPSFSMNFRLITMPVPTGGDSREAM